MLQRMFCVLYLLIFVVFVSAWKELVAGHAVVFLCQ